MTFAQISRQTTQTSHQIIGNQLLSNLPGKDYARLLPFLKPVRLSKGKIICHTGDAIRHCYFPVSGMISLLSQTGEGKTVEVGMVGSEGMIGIPVVLKADTMPCEVGVQITADLLQIRTDILVLQLHSSEALQSLLLRYANSLLCQTTQAAVCHRFHSIEQRFCRCLLISRERLKSNSFSLTQDLISQLLGVARCQVTIAAGILQRKGLISYTRGRIIILDKPGLEKFGCECCRQSIV